MDETIYMREALREAEAAAARDEVPIGAVLVDVASGDIVARAGNRTRALSDPSSHAEMLVIRERCAALGVQRIPDHDLYVTLEPCAMCAAVLSFARIRRVIYGAHDPKSGGIGQGPCLYTHPQLHHKPEVVSGVLGDICGTLLSTFFLSKR
ncbi:MAG: nucleoside deaminase [Pseudomonadota bacterium]